MDYYKKRYLCSPTLTVITLYLLLLLQRLVITLHYIFRMIRIKHDMYCVS